MNLACSLEITKVIIYSIWCFFIFCVKWIFELRFIWRTWSMNRAYGRRWCRGWFKRNTNPLEVLRLFFQWYIVESLFEEARLRTTISFLRSTKKNGIFVSDFRFSDLIKYRLIISYILQLKYNGLSLFETIISWRICLEVLFHLFCCLLFI